MSNQIQSKAVKNTDGFIATEIEYQILNYGVEGAGNLVWSSQYFYNDNRRHAVMVTQNNDMVQQDTIYWNLSQNEYGFKILNKSFPGVANLTWTAKKINGNQQKSYAMITETNQYNSQTEISWQLIKSPFEDCYFVKNLDRYKSTAQLAVEIQSVKNQTQHYASVIANDDDYSVSDISWKFVPRQNYQIKAIVSGFRYQDPLLSLQNQTSETQMNKFKINTLNQIKGNWTFQDNQKSKINHRWSFQFDIQYQKVAESLGINLGKQTTYRVKWDKQTQKSERHLNKILKTSTVDSKIINQAITYEKVSVQIPFQAYLQYSCMIGDKEVSADGVYALMKYDGFKGQVIQRQSNKIHSRIYGNMRVSGGRSLYQTKQQK